jgi:flagellum-specific peptidoglycan hydrolase FlgJ
VTRIDRKPDAAETPWLPKPPEAPRAPGSSFDSVLAGVQRQALPAATASVAAPSPAQQADPGQAARLVAAGADLESILPLFLQGLPTRKPAVNAAAAYKAYAPGGTPTERFGELKPLFVAAQQQTGVPWQVQAAQWALETGWGQHTPKDAETGRDSYNLFGVKGQGPAGSVSAATREFVNGQMVQVVDQFRAYTSPAESVLEHALLLTTPRYAMAPGSSLQAWTENLQRQGYATDPEYARKLWQILEQQGWDLEA